MVAPIGEPRGNRIMASLLKFAPRTGPSARHDGEIRREAQIIIFPGVRYERAQAAMRTEPASCRVSPLTEQPVKRG